MLREKALLEMDMSKDLSDEEVKEIIDDIILKEEDYRYLPLKQKIRLKKEIYDSLRGFDILQDILDDPDISEIMVNGTQNIFIEKEGRIIKYSGKFSSKERLEDIIQQIVAKVNRRVNETHPIVDARLEDGSRVNIVLDPVAMEGPVITIRKFPKFKMSMEHLIELGSINSYVAGFLKILVISGYNIFISGGTGTHK